MLIGIKIGLPTPGQRGRTRTSVRGGALEFPAGPVCVQEALRQSLLSTHGICDNKRWGVGRRTVSGVTSLAASVFGSFRLLPVESAAELLFQKSLCVPHF